MKAAQKEFTITPDKRRELLLRMDFPEDMRKSRRRVIMLPAKAVRLTPGNRGRPARIPKMAPIPDPLEIPRIKGSASGFLSRAWKTNPPMERAAPTSAARSTRGKRICHMMVCSMGSISRRPVMESRPLLTPIPVDPIKIPRSIDTARRTDRRIVVHRILFGRADLSMPTSLSRKDPDGSG